MGYTIAIAGKGGVGKTTISGLIIRLLRERKIGSILAVDADPNSNLGEMLGLKNSSTISDILDEISAGRDKLPAGMSKERFLEYKIESIIQEEEGLDLLAMGRPEGAGCYCYVNNVLRNALNKLIKSYDFVVIDNEAGMEHLSRKTVAEADALVVISDSTPAGLRAAEKISRLVDELKIKLKDKFLLVNRLDEEIDKKKVSSIGLKYVGRIPQDAQLLDLSIKNASVFSLKKDAVSLLVMETLLKEIIIRQAVNRI